MTLSQRTHAQIAPVALLVAGLAAADWYVAPNHALKWIVGIATMAVVWLVVILMQRSTATQTDSERRVLVRSAVMAGLMLAVALGAALLDATGFKDGMVQARAPGIVIGLMLVVIGNMVPKAVGPLAAKRCSPAQTQSLQRFTGWAFTLAGLAYTAVWIFAPVPQAENVSALVCAGAVLLVIGRWAWASS